MPHIQIADVAASVQRAVDLEGSAPAFKPEGRLYNSLEEGETHGE